jgi:hypothetical protein
MLSKFESLRKGCSVPWLFCSSSHLRTKTSYGAALLKNAHINLHQRESTIMRAGYYNLAGERTGAVVLSCSAEKSLIKSPWKCATRTRKVHNQKEMYAGLV